MKSALPIVGFALMIVAALFFVAGSPAVNLMPRNYANFAGIAIAAVAVLVWVICAARRGGNEDDDSE